MDENSSFDRPIDFFAFSELTPLHTRGATSDTYKVCISGKWHFLKSLKKEYADHARYVVAFAKEFDIGYTLDHPHIVRYVSKGMEKGCLYILTEYVDGMTLTEWMEHHPDYFKDKANRQRFVDQLFSAVSYLHNLQILHLDLKPDNILITNIGHQVKLVDLGFSYSDCYQFITTGRTNKYAAPEQLASERADQRTDIYGLGRVLSEIPYFNRHEKACIAKSLSREKENRYFNVDSFHKALRSHISAKVAWLALPLLLLLLWGVYTLVGHEEPHPSVVQSSIAADTINSLPTTKDTIAAVQADHAAPTAKDTIVIVQTIISPTSATPASQAEPAPQLSIEEKYYSLINGFRNAQKQLYELPVDNQYTLSARYEKWNESRQHIKRLLASVGDPEERKAINKILNYEANLHAASYVQRSVIKELEQIIAQPMPHNVRTPEALLLAFNKEIAPYYLPFYTRYVIIDNYATYLQAKNQLEEIKRITEPILHAVYPNNTDVYTSPAIFQEKFMARLHHYPFFNYIYPAEDLLHNYLFNYGE